MTTRHARYLSPILLCAALLLAACGAPPTVDYRMADARKHREKGDLMAAIIELKNVLKQQPGHAEARYLLGVVYLQSGDAVNAEKNFRKDLQNNNENGWALYGLYKALQLQKKNGDAAKIYIRFKTAFSKSDIQIQNSMY